MEKFVVFIDMEKAYDRVGRPKTFELLRAYDIHEKLVSLIERVYNGNMVKFELGNVVTGWCKSESGVRQGCPCPHFCLICTSGAWNENRRVSRRLQIHFSEQ